MSKHHLSTGKSSISDESSYAKIGEFWDTHDITDFTDDSEIVDFDVSDVLSSKIYYHIETRFVEEIRSIAKRQGITPSALINRWIQEKLRCGASPK